MNTYNKIIWQNDPSTNTPLSEANLNHMDDAIAENRDQLIALDLRTAGIVKGEKGDPGLDGTNATLQIGEVETLPSGTNAYVENVGTDTTAILNFGIPRGIDGTGTGTITGVKMNGEVKGTSGVVDLGNVLTDLPAHDHTMLSNQTISLGNGSIELIPSSGGGYIDFHLNGSSSDFTSRIVEYDSGLKIQKQGKTALAINGSLVYENISVSATASSSDQQSWDSNGQYLYSFDVPIDSCSQNMIISDMCIPTNIVSDLAQYQTTNDGSIKFYCKTGGSKEFTIISLTLTEVR